MPFLTDQQHRKVVKMSRPCGRRRNPPARKALLTLSVAADPSLGATPLSS